MMASDNTSASPGPAKNTKRKRTTFTTQQLLMLEFYFQQQPFPDSKTRKLISDVVGVDTNTIQIWFQNRRARYRKRESNSNHLKRNLVVLPQFTYWPLPPGGCVPLVSSPASLESQSSSTEDAPIPEDSATPQDS